jgi:hypothetical protein
LIQAVGLSSVVDGVITVSVVETVGVRNNVIVARTIIPLRLLIEIKCAWISATFTFTCKKEKCAHKKENGFIHRIQCDYKVGVSLTLQQYLFFGILE